MSQQQSVVSSQRSAAFDAAVQRAIAEAGLKFKREWEDDLLRSLQDPPYTPGLFVRAIARGVQFVRRLFRRKANPFTQRGAS